MLRVGVVGPQSDDSFAENIADSLPFLGVEVIKLGTPRPRLQSRRLSGGYDLVARAVPRFDGQIQKLIVRRALEHECDLVISTQSEMLPEVVSEFRRAHIPIVLWFPDAVSNLGRGLMFASDYSMVYFKDPTVVERVTANFNMAAKYLPEACNPRRHRIFDQDLPGDIPALVVAGNMYPTRARLLDRMIDDGVDLRIYGQPFPVWLPQAEKLSRFHTGEYIVGESKARVFRKALGVLNNLHPSELNSVNCRLFEAAASGAVVMTEYRTVLDSLFDMGSEVLAYQNYDELLAGLRRLKDDPERSLELGNAASARAHAEHTYEHRLVKILEDHVL